jgi:cytochrome c-type protein NapB
MSREEVRTVLALGALLLASSAVAAAAGRKALSRLAETRARSTAPPAAAPVAAAQPIPAERDVFRTQRGMTAIPPEGPRQRDAHPRTLARYRLVRAYPGAPPRIPHGFTADEFRTGACNTCHQRGGYAPRFDAYVPVTPHSDMPACLQCHVGRDEVTGVTLPSLDPSTVCRQCHASGSARWQEGLVGWEPQRWSEPPRPREPGRVPPIPHDLFFRGNCLACHSGPSAVAEIRTSHPDWSDCRGCHVAPDPAVAEYLRPAGEER